MTLSTYAGLQAALGTWASNRTDLPTADLITLAEAEMRAETGLRLRVEEVDSALVGVVDSRKIALPTAFQSAHVLWRDTGTSRDELIRVSPDEIDNITTSGLPVYWCVDGTNIAFERPCDQAYNFTLRNEQYLAALSDSNTTNWLLTNYPNLYLAAANLQAAIWMQDTEQTGVWAQAYQAALAKVSNAEARARGSSPLRTEIGAITRLRGRSGYNIYSGY